jgi:hypothetical protein
MSQSLANHMARVSEQALPSKPARPNARPNTQLAAENRASMNVSLADFIEERAGTRPASNSTTEQLVRQVSALGGIISCAVYLQEQAE